MIGQCPIAPPLEWGRQKPPPGMSINWNHPSSQGLVIALPCSDGSGLQAIDATGRLGPKWSGTGPHWSPTVDGVAATFNGTNDSILLANNGRGIFDNQQWTLLFDVTPFSSANYTIFFSYDYISHPEAPQYACHFRTGATRQYLAWNYAAGTLTRRIIAPVLPVGQRVVLVGVFTWGRQEIWNSGVLVSSASHTDTITYYDQEAWIGRSNFAFTKSMNLHNAAVWNRALSADEIRALSASPYSIYAAGGSFAGSEPAVPGPYYADNAQAACTGAVAGENFLSGATIGQDYHTGATAGSCNG